MLECSRSGKIDIVKTIRVMNDTLDKWKGDGDSPIWKQIQGLPSIQTIGSGFRLDCSRLNSPDTLLSKEQIELAKKIKQVMNDAQTEDRDHLPAHIISKREIFITGDKHFLDNAMQIERQLGAIVMKPQNAVKLLQEE